MIVYIKKEGFKCGYQILSIQRKQKKNEFKDLKGQNSESN